MCGLTFFLFQRKAESAVHPAEAGGKILLVSAKPDSVDWSFFNIRLTPPPGKTYGQTCREALQKRTDFREPRDGDAGKLFEEMLLNQIIPHWYGTKWNFYGHTNEPQSGEIACGYFVSTTLSHLGVNVDRYKLAQQSPLNEAKTLSPGGRVIDISVENSGDKFAAIRDSISEGICFVGLGNSHVGFLLKRKNELFFLHSSYFAPAAVTIEKAEESEVFAAYDRYFLVELSNHPLFVKKWLKRERFNVITD